MFFNKILFLFCFVSEDVYASSKGNRVGLVSINAPILPFCIATLSQNNVEIGQISLDSEMVSIEFDTTDTLQYVLTLNKDCNDNLAPSSITFSLPDGGNDLFFIAEFQPRGTSNFDSIPSTIDETAFPVILLYLFFSTLKKKKKKKEKSSPQLLKTKRNSRSDLLNEGHRTVSSHWSPTKHVCTAGDVLPLIRNLNFEDIRIDDTSTDVSIHDKGKGETAAEKHFNRLASLALSVPILSPSSPIKIKVDKSEGFLFSDNPLFTHAKPASHLKWQKLHGPSSASLRPSCAPSISLLRRRAIAMKLKLTH